MHKLIFCVVWFIVAIAVFVTDASILHVTRRREVVEFSPSRLSQLTAPGFLSPVLGVSHGISTEVGGDDARVDIVASFLDRHNSPLVPAEKYAKFIVDTSDKYGMDYRLIPAIMMQESNLCKAIPTGSFNCLGFGVHAGGTLGFDSYEEGIERATRELKANYIDQGLTTPEMIMTKYTPHSNGSWADSVNQWIAEMEYNDRARGRTEKSDADLTQYPQQ